MGGNLLENLSTLLADPFMHVFGRWPTTHPNMEAWPAWIPIRCATACENPASSDLRSNSSATARGRAKTANAHARWVNESHGREKEEGKMGSRLDSDSGLTLACAFSITRDDRRAVSICASDAHMATRAR